MFYDQFGILPQILITFWAILVESYCGNSETQDGPRLEIMT